MQGIFIEDIGKGTPFVLVHGFLGSTDMWKPQIKYFQDKYRVLVPALPGFGKSNDLVPCNSVESMANTILEALDTKHIKKFYLLGHSMGGMVVQEMAKIAGEKILKLICYGTGPIGNIPGRFETIDESRKRLKIDGLKNTAYRIAKTWFIDQDRAKYFYLCEEAGKQASLEATDNSLIAMKNWNGVDNLRNIKNETLIIWGEHDKAYNYNQISILRKNILKSELKIVNNCSHNVHLEKSGEFNDCVDNFLKKN